MKSGFRNVVLVGERFAKLDFICEFLEETSRVSLKMKCQDTAPVVEVIHSESFVDKITADKTGSNILVLSASFPSGIKFSVDLSETDWIYCSNAQDAGLILFVEAFPFTSDSLASKIELIEKFLMNGSGGNIIQNVQFRIMFFKNKDQHFGDTDKVDVGQALKRAPDNMINRLEKSSRCMLPISTLIDFKVYENVSDLIDIVSCNMKTFNRLTCIGREKFRQWQADLDYYCENYKQEYEYQFADSLRFEMIHNRVNKFSVVKGTNDIMRRYAENYRQKCFHEVKKIAVEQYRQCVYDICFWNLDRDMDALGRELDKLCSDELTFNGQLPCPELQADYQKILTEKKIDIRFSNRIKDLEQDKVPELVYRYLKKKEEILFGAFGE